MAFAGEAYTRVEDLPFESLFETTPSGYFGLSSSLTASQGGADWFGFDDGSCARSVRPECLTINDLMMDAAPMDAPAEEDRDAADAAEEEAEYVKMELSDASSDTIWGYPSSSSPADSPDSFEEADEPEPEPEPAAPAPAPAPAVARAAPRASVAVAAASPADDADSDDSGSAECKKRPRKRRRVVKEKDEMRTAVTLPRERILTMTLPEMEDYIRQARSQRKLTAAEEQDLKRQRRLVKNRESALASRNRKKEDMEHLQKAVDGLRREAHEKNVRIAQLEAENRTLKNELAELKKVAKSGEPQSCASSYGLRSRPKSAGLALMVVLFSFSMLLQPGGVPDSLKPAAAGAYLPIPGLSEYVAPKSEAFPPVDDPSAPLRRNVRSLLEVDDAGRERRVAHRGLIAEATPADDVDMTDAPFAKSGPEEGPAHFAPVHKALRYEPAKDAVDEYEAARYTPGKDSAESTHMMVVCSDLDAGTDVEMTQELLDFVRENITDVDAGSVRAGDAPVVVELTVPRELLAAFPALSASASASASASSSTSRAALQDAEMRSRYVNVGCTIRDKEDTYSTTFVVPSALSRMSL